MSTTIEIPDVLYQKAKLRAAHTDLTAKQIMVALLEKELDAEPHETSDRSFLERRTLHPGYAAALRSGAYSAGTDSTTIVSEDRSERENALL